MACDGVGEHCGVPHRQDPGRSSSPWAHLLCVPQVELGPRPAVERAALVTEEEWASHVGPEGRLQRVPELRARIFSGVRCQCGEGWAGPAGGRGSPLSCLPAPPRRV